MGINLIKDLMPGPYCLFMR